MSPDFNFDISKLSVLYAEKGHSLPLHLAWDKRNILKVMYLSIDFRDNLDNCLN